MQDNPLLHYIMRGGYIMQLTICSANCRGQDENILYPNRHVVKNVAEFKAAIENDHVCGVFRGNRRSKGNFIEADCLVMDCDNDHVSGNSVRECVLHYRAEPS